MSFAYPFSRTAEAMRPSPIRELFKMTQRRGMISFAGGLPDPIIFPVEEFASCAEALQEANSSMGKIIGSGSPPANEIIPRRCVILNSSRIGEGRIA